MTFRSFEGTSSLNCKQINTRLHKRIAVNLKTKANFQNQVTNNSGQAVSLLLLTAQNLHVTQPVFWSRVLAENRSFFIKATEVPGLLYKLPFQKTPGSLISFLQCFLCLHGLVNAQVQKWGVYRAFFPVLTAVSLVGSINTVAIQPAWVLVMRMCHAKCRMQ